MSDEAEGLIEDTFVTKLGAKYPFVKAKAGVNDKYGVKGFPTVYVIDANGLVYGEGVPPENVIEELLAGVTLAPKLPKESRYEPVRAMWEKREYAKLRDYLDKMLAQPNLDASMREVFDAQKAELGKRIEAQGKRIERFGAGPDYAAGADQLDRIVKEWKGFPPEAAAQKQLERFAADAAIKKELASGRALQKLCAGFDTSKVSQARKLAGELDKFRKKHVGTNAAKQAEEMMGRLSK